jgi:chemotaxis protein methyltransferase CheR
MDDRSCVAFLQWALPHMGMRWQGFRRVRRQVCRRILSRIVELGLDGPEAYRSRLGEDPGEWEHLATLCRVTISRFHRDRGVFRLLWSQVLPALTDQLARRGEDARLRIWSAGCASGEEPYTLAILWRLEPPAPPPDADLRILATDVDPVVLDRARQASYPSGTLRELPDLHLEQAFEPEGYEYCLRPEFREGVEFRRADLRRELPDESFHLILCRNLVFTYFDEDEQRRILSGLLGRLERGGGLVLGAHETLPEGRWPLEPWTTSEPVFRKIGEPMRQPGPELDEGETEG